LWLDKLVSPEKKHAIPVFTELLARLGWLIKLRWGAIAGAICAIEVARNGFGIALPRMPLYLLILGLAAYNLVLFLIARRMDVTEASDFWYKSSPVERILLPRTFRGLGLEGEGYRAAAFAFAQMVVDLAFLASMLHYSGGLENPFAFITLFHVTIASILLSRRATYVVATFAFLMVSLVGIGECCGFIRHFSLNLVEASDLQLNPPWVIAQLTVLGLILYLSAYLSSTISVRLRSHERDSVLFSREISGKAKALAAAYQQVSESEQLKSQYMRKVAHEIRGPLGTIQTSLQVVLEGLAGDLSEKTRDLVERAERRARELTTVATDLLTLSRARESHQPADVSAVRPVELVQEMVEELRPLAEKSELSLSLQTTVELGEVRADPQGLRQLVGNLLSNALRYTPRGGAVTVRVYRVDTSLIIAVQDTGIGIPKGDLERIFEEFYRSMNARKHSSDGTGLGMAIVKAVVDRVGGSIDVESEEAKGTSFTVRLPLYE
jgi:signal transduction histidine kinase